MTKSDRPGCFTVFLAFFLPPLGVLVRFGCGYKFWLCLLLTLLLYLPGIIYAVCVVYEERPKEDHHHHGHDHGHATKVDINIRS